jgi:HAUS augmin-like complex subunit 3
MLSLALFSQGEDLDSAFDSISAFSSKKDIQEAVFGSEETILDIRYAWKFNLIKL